MVGGYKRFDKITATIFRIKFLIYTLKMEAVYSSEYSDLLPDNNTVS
jgi:hypothetical protein